MGNTQSSNDPYQTLSGNELVEFTRLTPFSRYEIESFYDDFQKLDHSPNPRRNFRARAEDVARLPILKCNPFKDRIIQIFADQNSFLTFEDFLDMMSVFHPRCSKMVKLCHAFAIYDFDNDGYLGMEDLKRVVKRLTHRGDGSESIISQDDIVTTAERLMKELDLDHSGRISIEEFEYFTSKSPDFALLFSTRQKTC